ncbi:IS30 family transposase [Verrucomicrobiaceae bacterium 5K15]|uniref:IS30 family transposase n=1 Tax=Oceaniferula flava TaxID=2800421 RepID=A0AAE2SCQ0_9BACT|nr:IS30 family transposase [Oceaniferula flavus]MBK1854597.1 IS30 family transposase [Oceaniferula flavus]MBM1135903.1 IS30 family transposase [Oceaniferula flavus]
MKYRHLSKEERCVIGALRMQRLSLRAIAQHLGRSPSTISREIKRNSRSQDGRYRASHADSNYNARKRWARRGSRFDWGEWKIVERCIRDEYSPEQTAGRLKREGTLSISHETIYLHIWRNKKLGGTLYTHLRGSRKRRRKRWGRNDSRGRLPGKTMITERPDAANLRQEIGHWELDSVLGSISGRHCISTVVDRMSGYLMIGKLEARTKSETNLRLSKLISRCEGRFKTITPDNGTEFHGYRELEQKHGVKFYFAHPYHSWERGTNENTNGLIRQYLPKRQSMHNLTQAKCNAIANKLNNRPRKRLGYLTPNEVFHGLSNVALHT